MSRGKVPGALSWDEAEKEITGKFLKWADAPFKLRFSGEPTVTRKHFIRGMPNPCDGNECKHCGDGVKLDVNFDFQVETGDGEQVLTLSRKAMRELFAVKESVGDDKFYTIAFEANRTGSGKGTKYTFSPIDSADDIPF